MTFESHQTPFLRIIVPFVIGIAIGWYSYSYTPAFCLMVAGFAVYLVSGYYERKELYNYRHLKGCAIFLVLIACGISIYNVSIPKELAHKKVSSYQIYQYRKSHANDISKFEAKALDVREKLVDIYRKNVNEDTLPILSAITLGKKDELSKDVKDAFSLSGGSHVLAVSGLHVGIIYMILLWIASKFPYKRWLFVISHIIVIACLWLYAFLCGLPASVIRSAFMFSLISGSYILERHNLSLNAVFASAFFMLLFKPLYLFDVGFQLSYSAVISILLFYPKIFNLFEFRNKVLVWAWGMCAVSAAAQIGTLPLTVAYFHQIPVYSLITNFIVIPAAFVLIYCGATILIFGWTVKTASFIGILTDFVTTMLTKGVQSVVDMPFSVIYDVSLKTWQIFAVYIVIFCIFAIFTTKNA
ncbi:MAG: ComEC/Rec2 family competence protein [Paludibacteraceae bacterium]|nr:ComEC/Rec2 family competence protein [Paludibacteraceae bacterium]